MTYRKPQNKPQLKIAYLEGENTILREFIVKYEEEIKKLQAQNHQLNTTPS